MKHITLVSSAVPAKACLPANHPGLVESILAFLQDPQAVIDLHKKQPV